MERRDFNLKIKSLDDEGAFVGLGAVYGNVDLGGDVIDPGAFSRTLNAAKSFPVLWQHDPSNPIGTCKITDTPQGLQVNGTLMLSDPTAQKAHTFMKAGVVKGLSIGYDTVQATYVGDVRHLTELKLWEISCVTFPMNESAMVTGVKALSDDDRMKHLTAIREHSRSIDHHQRAIRQHLKSMLDDVDDTDIVPVDDPIFDEGDGPEEMSMLVEELKKLSAQAEALAS
jgi:uncharacterized protein